MGFGTSIGLYIDKWHVSNFRHKRQKNLKTQVILNTIQNSINFVYLVIGFQCTCECYVLCEYIMICVWYLKHIITHVFLFAPKNSKKFRQICLKCFLKELWISSENLKNLKTNNICGKLEIRSQRIVSLSQGSWGRLAQEYHK